MPDGRWIGDIDEFFEPGETLEAQLDDDVLARDLQWQIEVLSARRRAREQRAWADAEYEAEQLGMVGPTPAMFAAHLRDYEAWELDEVPS